MRWLTALFAAIILCPLLTAQTRSGTICVAPNSATPPTRFSAGDYFNPATLMLQIDNRRAIHWPHKSCAKISGLDLKARHRVVLTSDGKPLQSFRFRFSDYNSPILCLAFDGYGGPRLQEEGRSTPWCNCK